MQERQSKADYLYSPLLRSFKSCVRITALVLVAVSKFKRLTLVKQIERQEKPASALKLLDFPEAKFSVFNGQVLHLKEYRYDVTCLLFCTRCRSCFKLCWG